MGDRKRKLTKEASPNIHMTKKCPECFAYLPLDGEGVHILREGGRPGEQAGARGKAAECEGVPDGRRRHPGVHHFCVVGVFHD